MPISEVPRSSFNHPIGADRVGMMLTSATLRVPSHPIGCIVEKRGAVLHCIKCT